jgi:RNA polymerase sigma factor (sigma-70 family)
MPVRRNAESLAAAEREFLQHRAAVLSTLRISYPWVADPEELYQSAWVELLEVRARGEVVNNPRALLKKIVARRAIDLGRRRKAEPIEPLAPEIVDRPDLDDAVEIATARHLEADVVRQVIETLDPKHAVLLKLRFDFRLTAGEIQRYLGISEARFEKRMAQAYEAVRAKLGPEPEKAERWREHQRSLLLACESGIATPEQRARAQDLIDRDPQCRLMLRELRTTLRDVAVAIPLPPTVLELHQRRGPLAALLDWAEKAIAIVRPPGADIAVSRTTATLGEQAGATLAGGVGLGGAAKLAAACLALGGTAAVCVDQVVTRHKAPVAARAEKPTKRATQKSVVAPAPVIVRATPQPVTGQQVRLSKAELVAKANARARNRQQVTTPVSSPRARPPASPVPAGTTEFGPGATGSDPVAAAPAAAPQDGGGEFGP